LFLKRQLRTRFSLLKPSLAKTVEQKQQKQKQYHDKGKPKLRNLSEGDSVRLRNFRGGKEKWIMGKIVKRLGPVTYLIDDGVRERTVHVDHPLFSNEKALDSFNSSDHTYLTPDLGTSQLSRGISEAQCRNASTPGSAYAPSTPALQNSCTLPLSAEILL
ncbi:uncharacterized protein K02A2.6-like, partial [Scomber scombrus]